MKLVKEVGESFANLYIRTDKYDDYITKTTTSLWNILEGSIRSSKTVANTLALAVNILLSPDNTHMVCATTSTVATELYIDGGGLGLKFIFNGRCKMTKIEGRSVLRIFLPERTVDVIIMGMSTSGSFKQFHGMTLGLIAFSEIDLLDQESVIYAIGRNTASKHRRFFVDFNPTFPTSPLYGKDLQYSVERLISVYGDEINYQHCTLNDNPIMTKEMIDAVKKDYDPESIQYKRFILGQRVAAENLIYRMNEWNIIDNLNPSDYTKYIVIADPGVNASSTAFILAGLKDGKEPSLDILKEYKHRNADEAEINIKMPSDYAKEFVDFIDDSIELMGKYPQRVIIDPDVTFKRELRLELNRRRHVNMIIFQAKKEKIEDRIRMGTSLLWTKKLRFYKECKETILSFKGAMYEAKKASKGIYERWDDPVKGTMIDLIDAVEYGFVYFKARLYRI